MLEIVGFIIYQLSWYGKNFNDLVFSPAIVLLSAVVYYVIQNHFIALKKVAICIHDYIYDIYLTHHPFLKVALTQDLSAIYKLEIILSYPALVIVNHLLSKLLKRTIETIR